MRGDAVSARLMRANPRWIVFGLALAAAVLAIWVFFIGAQLHGRYSALALAIVIGIPLAVGLGALAWTTPEWCE